jgi:hypothetical protein
VTIVRYQETYAEDFSSDFEFILNVIKWKYTEMFATQSLPKGVTFRAIHDDQKSKECAELLDRNYVNSALNRKGLPLGGGTLLYWYDRTNAPDYLVQCRSACVEVDFGNEDVSH